jgi:membrane-associated phospholipid phosphatase
VNKKSSRKELLCILGLAIVATVVCICAHWKPRFPGDLRLTLLFQSVDSEPLTSVMEWVSRLGGGWPVVVLAVVVIASAIIVWRWLGRLEACLVLATGLSPLIYSVLKLIVNRPRPSPDLVRVFVVEEGSGFPSGHAFFATVFFGLLAYFAYSHLQKRSLRVLALSGFLLLILLVGASRVYLGAHWPSDVLGGFLLGAVFLAALIWLHRKWRPDFSNTSFPCC